MRRKPDQNRVEVLRARKITIEEKWESLARFLDKKRYEYLPQLQSLLVSLHKLEPDYFHFIDFDELDNLHCRATLDFEQLMRKPLDDNGKFIVWSRSGELEGILRRIRKRSYMERNRVKERRGFATGICACLLKGNRQCVTHNSSCLGPCYDHTTCFAFEHKKGLLMVHQPYVGEDDAIKVVTVCQEWAKKNGLAVRFSVDESWHYFGKTLLIEYRNAVKS